MSATHLALSRLLALGLLAFGLAAPASAGAPVLVDDLNPVQAYREGPQPQDFQAFGGQAVFIAFETQRGRTLWASDGTPAGTRRLAEGLDAVTAVVGEASGELIVLAARDFQQLRPGLWRVDLAGRAERLLPDGVTVLGNAFVPFRGAHYFFATPAPGLAKSYFPAVPTSLWRTDGTPAGTREVAPVGASDFTVGPLAFRGRLFFLVARRGDDDFPEVYFSLWASDGRSAAGTVGLADLDTASVELFLEPAGRRLLFPARARRGEELWGTDGTAAGTYALTDFPAEQPFSYGYARPTPAAGRLYFMADDGEHGRELWASDGTGRGTLRLTDFPGDDPFTFDEYGSAAIDAAGPGALFAADDGTHGLELWRTDGSPGSTALVADLCSGSCSGFVQPGLARNGRLLFTGRTPETGIEPWASDGTAEGTALLADLSAGDASFRFVTLGGEAAFVDQTEDFHFALYATDGSPGGTELLLDADLAVSAVFPQPFVELGRRLLFFGGDGIGRAELWAATLPRGSVVQVTDITQDQPGSSDPVDLTVAGDKLFFVACNDTRTTLYATAGSGASALLDLGNDCVNFFNPLTDDRLLSAVGGRAFLAYLDVWVSDGTPAGTVNLTEFDYFPTAFPIVVSNVADLGGLAAFAVLESVDPGGGYHERLWLSDGTPEGTLPTDALPQPLRVFELFSLRGRLYFWGTDAEGPGFWSSDGTAAGTHLLHRLPAFHQPPDEAPVDALGAVYFTTSPLELTLGLWRTDGTPEGTEEVALRPQFLFGSPAHGLTALGGALYFLAALGQNGERELWRTNGTAAGTVRLGPLGLDFFDQVVGPVTAGGRLFLFAAGSDSTRLWVSDGTPEGTRPVGPVLGPTYAPRRGLVAAGAKVFFTVVDPDRGWELWESSGTEAGTHLAADIAPGRFGSEPRELTVASQGLYFTADDGIFGREPWLLPSTPGCEPSPFALCLAGDRVQATLAWHDAGGIPRRAEARALAGDSGGFSFVDPARLEVVTKALDASGINGRLWAFVGSLSDASWELTLRDEATGGALRWVNLLHQQTARADLGAFPAAGLGSAEEAVRVLEESGLALAGRRDATLAPALTPAPPCQPAPGVLCLHGGRFRVEVGREGAPLAATVLPWSDLAGAFALAPGINADLAIEVLDGTGINGRFWVFGTALTDRAYLITVTDTVTGAQRTYAKPAGTLAGVADLAAF